MPGTDRAAAGLMPVASSRRAVVLDAVRGLALLGVLVANTLCFAYPQLTVPDDFEAMRGAGVADRIVLGLMALLVEGRFYSLLSVLFGIGLAWQADRALAAGRPFAGFYLWRTAMLFVIGVLHGVLLFLADILAFYAIIAAAALAFHRLSARALARAAAVSAALALVVLSAYAAAHPDRPLPRPPDWNRLAKQNLGATGVGDAWTFDAESADFVARGAAVVVDRLGVPPAALVQVMADEARIYREGSWGEMTRHRAISALLFGLPLKLAGLGFYVLACFLLGMSLARRGWFVDVRGADLPRYRRLCLSGVSVGFGVFAVGGALQVLAPRVPAAAVAAMACVLAGTLLQGLGYAGGIAWLAVRRPGGLAVRALAAVGRTALSNYLLQSVVLGTIFYATGFGLFTRLTTLPVVALTVPVFAFEAWASLAWLRRFEMGPVEWAWRSLAYRRRLPLAAKATVVGAALAIAALAIGVQAAGSADWPHWRGVNRDGRVAAPLPPAGWPARLSRDWAREVGGGYSGPVVAGDRVWIHSRQGEKELVSALRLASGEPLWSASYDAPFVQDSSADAHGRGPYATPTIADGRLFTFGVTSVLSVWDAATGRLLWRRESGPEFRGRLPYFGAAASPFVWGQLCFVHLGGDDRKNFDGPGSGAMMALNVADGREVWRWTGDGPAMGASPIIATIGGREHLIFKTKRKIVGLDPQTGKELWQFVYVVSQGNTIVTPLVLGDRLVTSDFDFGIAAWEIRPGGASGAWAAQALWRTRDASMFMSSPVVFDGLVVGFSHFRKGQLFALDPADGSVVWRGAVRGGEHATLVGWGDRVHVFGEDGWLEIHRVSRGGLVVERRYQVSGSLSWSHPAVTGTRMLVRDGTRLVAFGLGAR